MIRMMPIRTQIHIGTFMDDSYPVRGPSTPQGESYPLAVIL